MGIRVRAFRDGFYKGERHRVGSEFVVPDGTLESTWFAPVDPGASLKARPKLSPAEKVAAAHALRDDRKRKQIELAKAKSFKKPETQTPVALSQLHAKRTAAETVVHPTDEPLA